MLNHIGKAWCCEVQKKRGKQAKSQAQALLMTSFFQKKMDPIVSQILPNQAEESVLPLSRLWDISVSLPDSVPIVVPSDHIAALTSDPKEMVDVRWLEDLDEDPYEWFNKVLNGICGKYAKRNGALSLAIKWGLMGLTGLCKTLQYFIDNGLALNEILETHINNLIEEAKKVYVTILKKHRNSLNVTFKRFIVEPCPPVEDPPAPSWHKSTLLQCGTSCQPL